MSVDSLDTTTSNRSLSLLALLTVTTTAAAAVMVLWRYKRSLVLRFGNQVRNGAASAKAGVENTKNRAVSLLDGALSSVKKHAINTIHSMTPNRAALEKMREERDHALAALDAHGKWSERNDLALAQAAEEIETLRKLQSRETKSAGAQTDKIRKSTPKPAPITTQAATQTDAHDEFDRVSTGSEEPLHRVKPDSGDNAGSASPKQAPQSWLSAIFGSSQKPAEPTTDDVSLKT